MFLCDFKSCLSSFLAIKLNENFVQIQSKFGVGKCKNRTAADGPHDKREMPACAFRSVSTEVKSTSACSKNVHEFLFSFVYGVRFCTFLGYKMCPKTCKKQASDFRSKNGPKTNPKGLQNGAKLRAMILPFLSTFSGFVFSRCQGPPREPK